MKSIFATLVLLSAPGLCLAQQASDRIINGKTVQLSLAGKSLNNVFSNAGGASFSPIHTIAFENTLWANNLQDLVGTIVEVKTANDGSVTISQFLSNIKIDPTVNKVVPPAMPETEYKLIDKNSSASISFMGINPSITNEERYEYNSTTLAFTKVNSQEVDKSKVPTSIRCADPSTCKYYYINAAAVQTCEATYLKRKGKSLKVKDFPAGISGVTIPINGDFFTGNTQQDKTKKNIVFCTVLSLP